MKIKIINILYHPPYYEAYHNKIRTEINWDIPNGSWVGICGYDWPDLVGNEVLKLTDKFEYEVWQPDLRADKIYSHTFENGLVHKLFPAEEKTQFYMMNFQKVITSKIMLESISNEKKKFNVILNLNSNPRFFINNEIIMKNHSSTPILVTFHGNFTDYSKISKNNILKYVYALYKKNKFRSLLEKVNYLTYQNNDQKAALTNLAIPNEKMSFLTMGVDFDYWKANAKGTSSNEKIRFLIASRFVPLKQIDKIIIIFDKLKKRFNNFKLVIAGHGDAEYENYLGNISKDLIELNLLEYVGYKTGDDMLKLYNQSDYFITVSTSEGCSVSVMKAMACNVNIFSTNVGGTANLLEKYQKGVIVSRYNYDEWEKRIVEILEGKQIPILDRETAKQYFHWPNIASKFIEIYNNLLEKHGTK